MSGAIEKVIWDLETSTFPGHYESDTVAARAELAEHELGYREAVRLFILCAPQCEPLATTNGVVSQLSNYIAGQHSDLAALRADLEATKLALLDMEGQYETGLSLLRSKDATVEAQAKQIETLQRATSRACDVMSECIEHGECAGADRAEMRAAEKALVEAVLSSAPSTVAVVPLERLREIEWASLGVVCPACKQPKKLDHAPDCWLDNTIRDAENRVYWAR